MTYTLTAHPNTIVRDEDASVHPDRSRQHGLSGISSVARRGQRADALHAAACRKAKDSMAETQTPNFKWTKPDIGGDSSTWGNVLNTTIDAVDSVVCANQQAGLPIGSVAMFAGPPRR